MKRKFVLAVLCGLAWATLASAETIRGVDVEFVNIDNPGNVADTRVMSDGSTGYGAVGYKYKIGKYEITNAQWNTFTSAVGAPAGSPSAAYDESAVYTGSQQPVTSVSWYEAAQFCNYLTSGDKSKGVYKFSGNNANPGTCQGVDRDAARSTYGRAFYIPTEDEWYKAAYFKANGTGYSAYANGSSSVPGADNGWNYVGGSSSTVWNVGSGALEQNGTYDMMGNVGELIEGTPGMFRGGSYGDSSTGMAAWARAQFASQSEMMNGGFRIAEVPEPTTLLILGMGGLALRRRFAA
jgi:formylglycine-generating enzyme